MANATLILKPPTLYTITPTKKDYSNRSDRILSYRIKDETDYFTPEEVRKHTATAAEKFAHHENIYSIVTIFHKAGNVQTIDCRDGIITEYLYDESDACVGYVEYTPLVGKIVIKPKHGGVWRFDIRFQIYKTQPK